MQPVWACLTRSSQKEETSAPEEWLSQQLKCTREQLCKKSDFCDQLADRLRNLEESLTKRSSAEYQAREQLNATNAELRAASRAREQQEAEYAELRSLADNLKIEADGVRVRQAESEARLQSQATSACEAEAAKQAEVVALRQRLAQQEAAHREGKRLASGLERTPREEDAPTSPSDPRDKTKVARHQAAASAWEVEVLQQPEHESEPHEEPSECMFVQLHEASGMVKHHRVGGVEQNRSLKQELVALSCNLEQKEDDILSIQFDMVALQNSVADQARLVSENADAFQQAAEELADKDEKLSDAIVRQEELVSQMNEVSGKLQEKVERLSQELDRSRSAYQALDEQNRAVVSGLETERDDLKLELQGLRAEASNAASEKTSLNAALQRLREDLEKQAQSQLPSCDMVAAEEELAASKLREASLQQALSNENLRTSELQDQLVTAGEGLNLADVQLSNLASALERAQFIERQAVERAQEYRTSLELHREFGKDDFMKDDLGFPWPRGEDTDVSAISDESSLGPPGDARLSSVLLSVEMDLGFATANLSIAPWQTRADFEAVVEDFLQEHKVRCIFAPAIVRYLEVVEANAVTFPARVSANLVDVYSRYS